MRWVLSAAVLGLAALAAFLTSRAYRIPDAQPSPSDTALGVEAEDRRTAVTLDGVAPTPPARTSAALTPTVAADAITKLREALRWQTEQESVPALREVITLGPRAAELVPEVLALLANEESKFAQPAWEALGAIGEAAVDPLLEAVRVEYETYGEALAHRRWAMTGVIAVGAIGAPAVVRVARLLGDEELYFWALAAFQRLRLMRVPLGEAAPVVLERLHEVRGERVKWVIEAVPNLGRDANRVIPRLIELLASGSLEVQRAAATALGRIGPDASGALGELHRFLEQVPPKQTGVRREVEEAIAGVRGER